MDYFISTVYGQNEFYTNHANRMIERFNAFKKYPAKFIILTNNTNLPFCKYYDIKDDGFIDYKLINKFIEEIGIDSINTLTVIDIDVEFKNTLFTSIINSHKNEVPSFITYRSSFQFIDNKIFYYANSKIYNKKCSIQDNGHTGFLLSFNQKFLKNYRFPEYFVYGGFDYFITSAILKKCIKGLEEEFRKVPKNVYYNFVNEDLIHYYHNKERVTPWNLYSTKY
jgi:hypothetical protein